MGRVFGFNYINTRFAHIDTEQGQIAFHRPYNKTVAIRYRKKDSRDKYTQMATVDALEMLKVEVEELKLKNMNLRNELKKNTGYRGQRTGEA